jgi:SAM-dependent methyltransferase
MSAFWKQRLEQNAALNWDEFYKRHRTNFFKDRHYMSDEFTELTRVRLSGAPTTLLEAGCGVGNSVFPLLEEIPSIKVFAADFAGTAIQLLKASKPYVKHGGTRCHAFVCDLSAPDGEYALVQNILGTEGEGGGGGGGKQVARPYSVNKVEYTPRAPAWAPRGGVDLAMMMFCLSAIDPAKHKRAIANVARVMRPGAVLWFRDYAEADHAQMRFKRESRIDHKFYVRGDGTRSYFFGLDEIDGLMASCGLAPVGDTKMIERVVNNRKKGEMMHRAWAHGRYRKKG